MIEQYKTLFEPTQPIEIKEKNSRFISQCFPVLTKEEAEAYLIELSDVELDSDALKNVAGGGTCYTAY